MNHARTWTARLFIFAALLAVPAAALSAIPDRIGYQAVLRDAAGDPLDTTIPMIFTFYSAEVAGDEIMQDQHNSHDTEITTVSGILNVALGSGWIYDGSGPGTYTTLSSMFADYGEVWMEVRVGNETLSPRILIPSAAFAHESTTLDGLNSSRFLRSDAGDLFYGSSLIIGSSSTLDVEGGIILSGVFDMKTKLPDEDQEIHFFEDGVRGGEKFLWDDSADRFEFTDDAYAVNGLSNGSTAYIDQNIYFNDNGPNATRYLYFYDNGSSTGRSIRYDHTGPWFRFSTDLETSGITRIWDDLYLNPGGPAGDQHFHFFDGGSETGQSLSWNNADQKFTFSDDLRTTDSMYAGPVELYEDWDSPRPTITFYDSVEPGVLAWDRTGYIVYKYHFTLNGNLRLPGKALWSNCPGGANFSCFGGDLADEWQIAGINDVYISQDVEVDGHIYPYRIHGGANSSLTLESDEDVRSMFDDDFSTTTNRAEWYHDGVYAGAQKLMEMQEDGDLRIRGTLSQNVAFDAAETFLASEFLPTGTLVSLEPARPGAVRRCSGPDDAGVLGVVSASPGLLLGSAPFDVETLRDVWGVEVAGRYEQEAETLLAAVAEADPELEQIESAALERFFQRNFVAVALAGRVPVAVDARGGEIVPGDRLVPGSAPGFAEKGDDSGTVVGIALERFSGGQGRVLALVFPPSHAVPAAAPRSPLEEGIAWEEEATDPVLPSTGDLFTRGAFRPQGTAAAVALDTTTAIQPGFVVSSDPLLQGALRPAVAGDAAVIGIVSGDPGIVLGSGTGNSDAQGAVSLAGTVECLADAGFGAIRPGDLLVASPNAGHAMRSDHPVPGAILAKALEPLDSGAGTIRVLVWGR